MAALSRELDADPGLSPREAARHLVARLQLGRGGSVENRARHLLRVAVAEARAMQPRPGPVLSLWPCNLQHKLSREGERMRHELARRDALRWRKIRASVAHWGSIFWRAQAQRWRIGMPHWDNDDENLEEYLANLDWYIRRCRALIR